MKNGSVSGREGMICGSRYRYLTVCVRVAIRISYSSIPIPVFSNLVDIIYQGKGFFSRGSV